MLILYDTSNKFLNISFTNVVIQEIDFENSWKIVTIFIGGNDLCDLTSNSSRPQNYIAKLEEGIDILHQEVIL